MFQVFDFVVFFFEEGMEPLDGCERDAVCVYGTDAGRVFANAKGGMEVLGGGPDVADYWILRFVTPLLDGQAGNSLQHVARRDGGKVDLGISVAQTRP